MLELFLVRPGLITSATIRDALVVGVVVVALAVVFRRFRLATATTMPMVVLVGGRELRPPARAGARRRGPASTLAESHAAHHAVTAWFVVGVVLVVAFLLFALVVTAMTIYRARVANTAFYYPEDAEPARRARRAYSADPGGGDGDDRGDDRRGGPTTSRRSARSADCLPHLRRLALLTREFLLCVQDGWPTRISLRSERTRWFLDALVHATHLVADNRVGQTAAISEAERRWVALCGSEGGQDDDRPEGRNIPDSDSS